MIARATLLGLQVRTAAARAVLAATAPARRHAPPPADGPLRVLMLAQYPEQFAGTKYRLGVWARRLRASGHVVDLSLAVPAPHAERLAHDWSVAARAEFHRRLLAQRIPAVRGAAAYDVAVLHMNDLPFWEYGAPFVARALARRAGRVLLDLDDLPVFGGEASLRPRTRQLAAAVDGLILGTEDLREHFPGRPCTVVPTCLEPSDFPPADRSGRSGPVLLGWVGSPGNLVHLESIAAPLAAVCGRHGARVRVVSSRAPVLPGVPVDFVPWSAGREAADLEPFDIGLAPLLDGPMERCKCGLKALQCMASGLPIVASPVGALARIVADGETGFHARSDADWEAALGRLVADARLRLGLGAAGRAAVAASWSFDAHAAAYEAAVRGTAT